MLALETIKDLSLAKSKINATNLVTMYVPNDQDL